MKREEERSSGLRTVLHERGARNLAGNFDVTRPEDCGMRSLERSSSEVSIAGAVDQSAAASIRRLTFAAPQWPNQPPEPTAMSVTPRADARVAPAIAVAHL
jgi:hypothetical protein